MNQPEFDPTLPVEHDADVLLFPAHKESLDPDTLSDADCIALFVSSWIHPNIHSSRLPETIINDTTSRSDPWEKKLSKLIDNAPYDDDYLSDPTFSAFDTYIRSTKARADELVSQRRAVLRLMELRAHQLAQGAADDDTLLTVFKKMTQR